MKKTIITIVLLTVMLLFFVTHTTRKICSEGRIEHAGASKGVMEESNYQGGGKYC